MLIFKYLNFTKIINSSLRERIMDLGLKKRWEKEIYSLENHINNLIDSLPISENCKEAIVKKCKIRDQKDKTFSDYFLEFADKYITFDKTDKLRYGDIWLHVTKTSIGNDPPKTPSLERSPTIKESNNVLTYLKEKILDRYAYFFDEKWLGENPDLTFALAQAIDEKSDELTFKG